MWSERWVAIEREPFPEGTVEGEYDSSLHAVREVVYLAGSRRFSILALRRSRKRKM
jgi:hypothetical protein